MTASKSPSRSTSKHPTAVGASCDADLQFDVERNTSDPNRQAVDFFTSCCSYRPDRVQNSHLHWHSTFDAGQPGALSRRRQWFRVAGLPSLSGQGVRRLAGVLRLPRRWRRGPAARCRPSTAPAITRTTKPAERSTYRFWTHSCRQPRPHACRAASCPGTLDPAGGLADIADENTLGCTVEFGYHASTHFVIAGNMRSNDFAVKDPLFWQFHKALTGAAAGDDSLWERWRALNVARSPQLSWVLPPNGYRVTELPTVTVTFHEPVSGVRSGDLRVNGSMATLVEAANDIGAPPAARAQAGIWVCDPLSFHRVRAARTGPGRCHARCRSDPR